MLLLSSDRRVLEMNCDDADAFPPGTLFISQGGEVTGELTMLMSDDWDSGEEDWAWEEVDFLVQDGEMAAAAELQMETKMAAERRWHASTGGLTRGLGLSSHCKRSHQILTRVDVHSPGVADSVNINFGDMHRVGSKGEVNAAA